MKVEACKLWRTPSNSEGVTQIFLYCIPHLYAVLCYHSLAGTSQSWAAKIIECSQLLALWIVHTKTLVALLALTCMRKILKLTIICFVPRSRKDTFFSAWAAHCLCLGVGFCNKINIAEDHLLPYSNHLILEMVTNKFWGISNFLKAKSNCTKFNSGKIM